MPLRALSLLLAPALLLAACAVSPDLAQPPTFYIDEYVHRDFFPQSTVTPADKPRIPQTAMFFPLANRLHMKDATHVAKELSRVFWGRWLKLQVFDTLPFAENEPWKDPAAAVARARAAGFDLAVGGEFTYLLFGGSAGTSTVSLRLDIYDTASGELIWSMAHAGTMAAETTRDYFVLAVKNRLPTEPAAAIVAALAEDLGKPVREWNWYEEEQRRKNPQPSPLDDPKPQARPAQ
ncbi:MAG: hypothetical protein AB1916_16220 [Thermodesulfobacteriota bacterium]